MLRQHLREHPALGPRRGLPCFRCAFSRRHVPAPGGESRHDHAVEYFGRQKSTRMAAARPNEYLLPLLTLGRPPKVHLAVDTG